MVDNVVTKMRDFHLEVVIGMDTSPDKSGRSHAVTVKMERCKDVLSARREQAYLSNHHKVLCFQGVGTERCGNGWTAVVWQNHSGNV
jgi:hypothetical protein